MGLKKKLKKAVKKTASAVKVGAQVTDKVSHAMETIGEKMVVVAPFIPVPGIDSAVMKVGTGLDKAGETGQFYSDYATKMAAIASKYGKVSKTNSLTTGDPVVGGSSTSVLKSPDKGLFGLGIWIF